MIYVEFHPHFEKLAGQRPRIVNAETRRVRGSTTDADAIDALLDRIDYQYCRATATLLRSQATTGRREGNEEIAYLAHVGFSLDVGAECRICWARFEVGISSEAQSSTDPKLTGLLPTLVEKPVQTYGPVRVDSSGGLEREKAEPGTAGPESTTFSPKWIGFIANARIACWDVFPEDRRTLNGSDKLLVGISSRSDQKLILNARLWICIEDPAIKPITFECPGMPVLTFGTTTGMER